MPDTLIARPSPPPSSIARGVSAARLESTHVVDVDITNAMKIPGWMTYDELEWLAHQAGRCASIAEVGSYCGRSTRALAEHTAGILYAIDTWEGSSDFTVEEKGTDGWLFQEFTKNMSGLANVHPMRMTSLEAAAALKGRQFDLIFIDAEHDYDSVKADIEAWRRLLKPGGTLCGHDYIRSYPGVLKAVGELMPGFSLAADSIWYKAL
jgi:predicted O-methyltransferase YrrM